MPVVQIEVDAADAELAADALWQAGPSAVSEVPLASGRVRLIADVAVPGRVDERWSAEVVEPDTTAHLDAWRAFAVPQRAGRRLVVHPAWLERGSPADADDVVVLLDPGRAFGSGSHPSTALSLAHLEEQLQPGDRVLDVGCGSGVLAVAACLLGAASATAIDIDPVAVEVTQANAAANGITPQIAASTTALSAVPGSFEVVMANIGAAVLRDLADALVARLAPGGRLVLAGLLDDQVDLVLAAYPDCTEAARSGEEGWTVVVLRR